MTPETAPESPAWSELRPVIDAAIGDLADKDREALLLRYFENRSHREIGELLGLTDNAARMRVDRALDRVRGLLAKRGVTSTASGLAAALLAHGAFVTTTVTAAQITATALATATAAGSGFTLLHLMTATQLKTGLAVTALVAGMSVPLAWQHRANGELRRTNAAMAQELARVAALEEENRRLRGIAVDHAELEALRLESAAGDTLRGEVRSLTQKLESLRNSSSGTATARSTNAVSREEAINTKILEVESEMESKRKELRKRVSDWLQKAAASNEADQTEAIQVMRLEVDARRAMAKFSQLNEVMIRLKAARSSSEPHPEELVQVGLEPVVVDPSIKVADPVSVLRLRESIAISDNGEFRRLYWFADGHSEEVVQSHPDFSAWEKARGVQ